MMRVTHIYNGLSLNLRLDSNVSIDTYVNRKIYDVINTMGTFIVNASGKYEIVMLMHHQSGFMHLVNFTA